MRIGAQCILGRIDCINGLPYSPYFDASQVCHSVILEGTSQRRDLRLNTLFRNPRAIDDFVKLGYQSNIFMQLI